ncbi:alpha/beta hydrolase [Kineobactrum salinum]|uniref:Alpha/beta hydrolase n=1 Tax=Kineobactrum salinum TaxID=2708301 RepID=A0A6C0U7Q0_9GAMM|nr:alpha/beta hydrolase [Kineobactrum salinum]QIB65504.1 alpha/beta hydrolase [Kineobactrum salinum]
MSGAGPAPGALPVPDAASLQTLREALPPFAQGRPPGPELVAFCRYYGMDFSQSLDGVSHQAGVVLSGPYRLAVHSWQIADAHHNLLLVHGYLDHCGLYRHLVDHALQRGCNVLAFDLPGHGLSTGTPAAINDFAEYGDAIAAVLAAAELPALPWQVLAQSTGAAALVEFARHHAPWPFTGTVLLAPLLQPARWWQVRAAHGLLQRLLSSVPRDFATNSSDREFLAFVRSDPLQAQRIPLAWVGALRRWLAELPLQDLGVGPALLVQGDADTTVDWRFNLPRYGKLFPGLRIELVHGAGHHLANESPLIRARYLEVIDRYLGW